MTVYIKARVNIRRCEVSYTRLDSEGIIVGDETNKLLDLVVLVLLQGIIAEQKEDTQ